MAEVTNWRSGKSSAEQRLYSLKHGIGCDAQFTFGPNKTPIIEAHKFILASHSDSFEEYFAVNTVMHLKNVEPMEFQLMLEYMYSGSTILFSHAFILHKIAIDYRIVAIGEQCTKVIQERINDETVFVILEHSSQLKDDNLHRSAVEYICFRAYRLFTTEAIYGISKANLMKLLARDELRVLSEIQVYEAVLKWAFKHENVASEGDNSKRIIPQEILRLIRFPLMDKTKEFYAKVAPSGVLSFLEKDELRDYFELDPEHRTTQILRTFNTKQRLPAALINGRNSFGRNQESGLCESVRKWIRNFIAACSK